MYDHLLQQGIKELIYLGKTSTIRLPIRKSLVSQRAIILFNSIPAFLKLFFMQ